MNDECVPEYCPRCMSVQPVKVVRCATYAEWKCKNCDWQHDCETYDCDEDNEPVGSCDNCGTNLYRTDDDYFCDQCLWHAQRFGTMR